MKKVIGMILCFLFLGIPLLAATPSTSATLGKLEKSSVTLDFNGYLLETYTAFDNTYIPVSRLKDIGLDITFFPEDNSVIINAVPTPSISKVNISSELGKKPFSLYNKPIFINQFQTHGIVTEGRVLIPIGALRSLYDITIESNTLYHLTPKELLPFSADQVTVGNYAEYPATISIVDLYWDNGLVQVPFNFNLNPQETLTRPTSTDQRQYISTVITKVLSQSPDLPFKYNNSNMYGQVNDRLFKTYTQFLTFGDLSTIGDPIDIDTIMWAQNTVNTKGLTSKTPYLVWTNIKRQSTYIFEGSKGNWKLIKHFKCSTGRNNSTPRGTFSLTQKVPYFGVEKGYRCKNAFGFIGTTYLYHSVMFDKTGSYLLKGKGELGSPASAGCIRLAVPHSEWFYKNLKSGSTVFID